MQQATGGTPTPIIDISHVDLTLTSRAGAVEILRDVSLTVTTGQSVAVVGPSGSGKTSLLMVLAGLERATAGRISVVGQDLAGMSEDERAAARGRDIGIVFQSFHLVPTMTAIENIALPLEFAGRLDAMDVARELLSEVGLAGRAEHFPAELSGGEQQRVALARALSGRPRLILADEPTGNLDTRSSEEIVAILQELHQRGRTIVMITHEPDLAAHAQRIVQIRDGRVVDGVDGEEV